MSAYNGYPMYQMISTRLGTLMSGSCLDSAAAFPSIEFPQPIVATYQPMPERIACAYCGRERMDNVDHCPGCGATEQAEPEHPMRYCVTVEAPAAEIVEEQRLFQRMLAWFGR